MFRLCHKVLTQSPTNDISLLMQLRGKGTIGSKRPCEKCGLVFHDTGNSLECPNGHSPALYELSVYCPPIKKTIRIRYDKRGERIRSYKKAVEVLIEINSKLKERVFDPSEYDKEKIANLQFDTAIRNWWREVKTGYAPKTQKEYEKRIENLFIPFFRKADVKDITAKQINDFFNALRKREAKTKNNIMGVLKSFFDYLNRMEIIKKVPTFPRHQKITYKARTWCRWDVFMTIINEIPESIDREAIITMRLEMLRVGEVRGLLWEDLLFDEDTLIVRNSFSSNVFRETTKTGDYKVKHLHSLIKEMLLPRQGLPKGFVFEHKGRPYSESWLRKQFNTARQKSGYSQELTLSGATRHSKATESYL